MCSPCCCLLLCYVRVTRTVLLQNPAVSLSDDRKEMWSDNPSYCSSNNKVRVTNPFPTRSVRGVVCWAPFAPVLACHAHLMSQWQDAVRHPASRLRERLLRPYRTGWSLR